MLTPTRDGAHWLHPTATSACSATIRNGCLFVCSPNTPFDITEGRKSQGLHKVPRLCACSTMTVTCPPPRAPSRGWRDDRRQRRPPDARATAPNCSAELHAAFGRYVIFPSPEAHDAVVLWCAATHGQPAWEHAPRLTPISPEKRCGKSRLMDVAEAVCHHVLITVNVSTAAVVRSITPDDPPTLMVDEADTIFGTKRAAENHEDVRGILNAGHQRNRPYVRWDITTRSREECPTFAMAMLAAIGDLPDTIMDRAIVIRMRRRGPGEKVAPFRTRRDAPALRALRDRLHNWVRAHIDILAKAEPDLPVEDRAADTWEPLIIVAGLAGGDWPDRARRRLDRDDWRTNPTRAA